MALTISLAGTAAQGHHSSAPHYDANQPVNLEGSVTEFEFVNPHAFLHVEVPTEDGGTVVWNCEMPAAVMLRRQGWSPESIAAGDQIAIEGIAARRDPHGCSIRTVVLADGTEQRLQGAPAVASDSGGSTATPARDDPSHGIAGLWVRDSRRRPNGPAAGPGPADAGPPGPESFTAEGVAAQSAYDQRFDDPSFRCSPSSIVRAWSGPGTPTEIALEGDSLTIRHEYMDTLRSVRINTRDHGGDLAPVELGHSIGWFEGDTLVIDTIGYAAGVLLPHPGILHSDALHTVERLSVDRAENTLHVAWTAEDPKFFSRPFSGEFLYQPSPYAVQPFGCTLENANR